MIERFAAPIESIEPLPNGMAYIIRFARNVSIVVHRDDLPKGYDPPAVGDIWRVELNAYMESRPR